MTFEEVLAKIVDETPGAVAGAIMGSDGIPVEEYQAGDEPFDLTAAAIEFQRVLEEAGKAAGTLYEGGRGILEELILVTGSHQLLFRQIDQEYFLVVALGPLGTLGKARYLVRSLIDDLRHSL